MRLAICLLYVGSALCGFLLPDVVYKKVGLRSSKVFHELTQGPGLQSPRLEPSITEFGRGDYHYNCPGA